MSFPTGGRHPVRANQRQDSQHSSANCNVVKIFHLNHFFYQAIILIVLFSCWSSCCLSASAQIARTENVPPAFVLANGMRVVTRERHVSPLVALDLWVRAGAREETDAEDGCAHFLEHVLFKGTTTRPSGQADIDIENLGATLTAATGPDYAHFYTTVAAAHVQEALAVLADVARNAALPPVEIERERGVILDELAAHDSNPTAHLIDALYRRAFHALPYGRSPGGSSEAIRRRTRDAIAAFYARAYRPERCVLVLVGDITSEQAKQLARQAFGDWQLPAGSQKEALPAAPSPLSSLSSGQAEKPFRETTASAVVPTLPDIEVEETGAFSRDTTGLAFPGPPARDYSMAAAAQIVAEILGDSREYGRLHADSLPNVHTAAHYTPRLDSSLWLLTAQETEPRPNTPRIARLRAIAANLGTRPPTSAELQTVRGRILGRMQADTETNAGLAYAVGYATMVGSEPPEALRARLQATTGREVQDFLHRYLLAQPGSGIHLLPATPKPILERRQ